MTKRLLKETKISRRNAKSALRRAGKSLRHLIESKPPGKEVREVLSKVQEAYDKLQKVIMLLVLTQLLS